MPSRLSHSPGDQSHTSPANPHRNRAVSPVIGVILMVSITVILATVVGVFVFGFTDIIGPVPPSNAIDVSGEVGDSGGETVLNASLEHTVGDSVTVEQTSFVLYADGSSIDRFDSSTHPEAIAAEDELRVGETISIEELVIPDQNAPAAGAHLELKLIHEPSDSIIASGHLENTLG